MLALGAAPGAAAQDVRVRGQVVVGAEPPAGRALAGAWAVLHEVTLDGGGPVDSVRTDADGRFRMMLVTADTSAVHFVSTQYAGITYFTSPVDHGATADTVQTLVVYDTSSTAPRIRLAQRHVIVRTPEQGGDRPVLEILSLSNDGDLTRISDEAGRQPVWRGRIPAGAIRFEMGQSDVSPQAVSLVGDTLGVSAPIPPGQKQLVFSYALPGGRDELELPIDQAVGRLTVLLEDTSASLTGGELVYRGVEVFDDRPFALYDGAFPRPSAAVVFRFSRPRFAARGVWGVLVAMSVAAMLLALIRWARRAPAAAAELPGVRDPDVLARRIAALDAAFEQQDPAEREEERYRAARADLKARLVDALAQRSVPR